MKSAFSCAVALLTFAVVVSSASADPGDIVFVTQPPLPNGFGSVNATFGNHEAGIESSTRGGDLYIRYADGTLKNLTQSAGLGQSGMQGASAIAVRDPAVHWSGQKVIFSMAVGAPTRQYEVLSFRWQLYEVSGLGRTDTPSVTKVPFQPLDYNNVNPAYGSDGKILFTTDRPLNGAAHLYPQRDEYESANIVSGLWKLDPMNGELVILDHSPSGDFSPFVDSFGRVIFTRWDHLQRDQQKDAGAFGAFDYSSEASDSTATTATVEVFPEPRDGNDPDRMPFEERHTLNQFFPWMSNQDGTDLETLNHVGRQELSPYFNRSRNDDPSLIESGSGGVRTDSDAFHHLREDPLKPGYYFAISAPEFGTHASGQIVALDAPPSRNPDELRVLYVTHQSTRSATNSPSPSHSGFYRNPLPLSTGSLVAAHTASTVEDENIGTSTLPRSRHDYRLKSMVRSGNVWVAGAALTPGIKKTISFWSPDRLISYPDVTMWELQPVELVARAAPPLTAGHGLAEPEQAMFDAAGVSKAEVVQYLRQNDLALIVSRNVTTRDRADKQQPFNLRISGTTTATTGGTGKLYDVAHLQIFQGDLIRGYGGADSPERGRRVLARAVHATTIVNPENPGGPAGSVKLGSDGSMAAFVPARRALTWQLTDGAGQGIVRERYWVTFQPGEIRLCGSCHGVNTADQAGRSAPLNRPEALRSILEFFKTIPHAPAPPEATATPDPNGGGIGEPGTFTLAVKAAGKKRIVPLRGGKPFQIEVSGPAGSRLALGASVDGIGCAKPLGTILLGENGTSTVEGSLPAFTGTGEARFRILSDSSEVANATVMVRGQHGRMSPKKAVCRATVNRKTSK